VLFAASPFAGFEKKSLCISCLLLLSLSLCFEMKVTKHAATTKYGNLVYFFM